MDEEHERRFIGGKQMPVIDWWVWIHVADLFLIRPRHHYSDLYSLYRGYSNLYSHHTPFARLQWQLIFRKGCWVGWVGVGLAGWVLGWLGGCWVGWVGVVHAACWSYSGVLITSVLCRHQEAYVVRAMWPFSTSEEYLFINMKSENKGFWLVEKSVTVT